MTGTIATVAEMEACLGVPPLGVKMKVIDHLDDQARAWIAASRLAFVGVAGPDGPRIGAAGGEAGFARTPDARTLRLPFGAMDDLGPLAAGQGVGLLFLAGGIGETLRANGRIRAGGARGGERGVAVCVKQRGKARGPGAGSAEPCLSASGLAPG
ncbi:MAG: pyridoxamine 5'-phosphate oxidase family protein [Phenylobacterium sp.]|nr:pyridoxamine 5'-phosphate oxidase family protein [Phenylobacterium sp.]